MSKGNYVIIKDHSELDKFVSFLPDLEDGEQYYISLFSRKKYLLPNSSLKLISDKGQLRRICSKKEFIIQKIQQFETKINTYYHDKVPVPQETLAIYISPNPRSFKKAMFKSAGEFIKLLENENYKNPYTVAMNMIQNSGSRNIYFDLDVDFLDYRAIDDDIIYSWINTKINKEVYCHSQSIIRTRGGFHILLKIDEINIKYKTTWYKSFSDNEENRKLGFEVTMNGCDNLVPIPGCVQGNFVPYII